MRPIFALVSLLLVSNGLAPCRGQHSPEQSHGQSAPAAPATTTLKGAAGETPAASLPLRERTSITNETLPAVLSELATPDKQIVLAVVHLGEAQALDFLKNWVRRGHANLEQCSFIYGGVPAGSARSCSTWAGCARMVCKDCSLLASLVGRAHGRMARWRDVTGIA